MSVRGQDGFTYLGLMIVLAVIGVAAAGTLQMGAVLQRHAAEEELLAIGLEFREALKSYAHATAGGAPAAPYKLEDLVRDPRYPNPKRHLRRVPADPLTGQMKWGLILGADGKSIIGIHSLSKDKPIKIANFPLIFQGFDAKSSYSDWIFVAGPQ
jgi:type II secretory pathway pseudopilin PulG